MDETAPEHEICQSTTENDEIDYGPLDDYNYIEPNQNDPNNQLNLNEEDQIHNAVASITPNEMNPNPELLEDNIMQNGNIMQIQNPVMGYNLQPDIPRYSPDFISNEAAKEKLAESEKILDKYRQVVEETAKFSKLADEEARILKEKQDALEKLKLEQSSNLLDTTTGNLPSAQIKKVIPIITIKQEIPSENEDEDHLKIDKDEEKKKPKGSKCHICNKNLPHEAALKAHVKKWHNMPANPQMQIKIPPLGTKRAPLHISETNPPQKIICQLCHSTIPNQTMLETHMITIHGLNIPPINPRENNSPIMSLNENFNDYNPPPPYNFMIPEHREFYRNHPNESRVTAANRRLYISKTHTRYKEVVDWIIEEITIDLRENPWHIAMCTRNKNTDIPEKRLSTCQWYQTGRCPDRRACHAEKKEFKVSYIHACEICYKVRNGLVEHPADNCELLELLDMAELGQFPDPDILRHLYSGSSEQNNRSEKQ